MKKFEGYKHLIFIFLFCSLYLILGSLYPTLPGLYMDEVIRKNPGFNIVHRSIEPPYPYHFSFKQSNGREFPIMLKPYIGAVYAYRTAFFTSIFGCSATAERLENVFITFIALIFTFLIVKKMTNNSVAILTCLFLSVDNSFVFLSKVAFLPHYFFKVSLIYLLFLYTKYNRPLFLYLSGVWAGIGVWTRADFIIIPVSIVCVFFITAWKIPLLEKVKRASTFVKGFMLGALPFLLYNIFNPLSTFNPMFRALIALKKYNISPIDGKPLPPFTENLIVKLKNLTYLLNGGAFNHLVAYESPKGIPYLWSLYLLGTILSLFVGKIHKDEKIKNAVILSAIFGGATLLQIIIIPQARSYHHLVQIFPLPQLFIAIPIYIFFSENKPWFNWKKLLSVFVCAVVIGSHIFLDINTVSLLKKTGGRGNWSDAIYELFDYLHKNKEKNFIIMDWGISSQLYYMSCGKAKIKELFWNEKLEIPVLNSYLMNENNLFVFHSEKYQHRKNLKRVFFEATKGDFNLVKTIFNREGEKIFEIYSGKKNWFIVPEKNYIDFSEKKHEVQLFGEWHKLEGKEGGYYRWTGRKFGFYLDNSKGYDKLLIKGYSVVDKVKNGFLEMDVYINGRFVHKHRFERNDEFVLEIPLPPDIKKEKILKVEAELDKTFRSPPDVRELGIVINSIGLKK